MINFKISMQQMTDMIKLQDRLNSKVNLDWKKAGNAWCRAIWIECAELMGHIGWKWWKKQEPDVAQAKLELVDIWHFMLSQFIQDSKTSIEFLAERLIQAIDEVTPTDTRGVTTLELAECMAHGATRERIDGDSFIELCTRFGMTGDELYQIYIGKNVLNIFRQDNGYKDGTYRKHWFDGREDNEHLNDIFVGYPNISPDDLLIKLGQVYNFKLAPEAGRA